MNEQDIYYIPVNFTDAGRVLGLFELRNCIEAAVLAVPTVGLCTLDREPHPVFAHGKAHHLTLPARAGLRLCARRHKGRVAVKVPHYLFPLAGKPPHRTEQRRRHQN